jgi:hypothetical protein
MASAPRPVRNEATEAETETGLFRCVQCGAIFNTEAELRDHEEATNHRVATDEEDLDRAAGEGLGGDFDQIDGPRYDEHKKE